MPLFNEEQCLQELYPRICAAAQSAGLDFEVVFVDDCSTDSTLALLKRLREQDSRVKVVSFSRNFGHQIAVTAGIRYASGACAVVMDGDLQDPPELVGQLIGKWREGFKVVYCVRRSRKESWLRRASYYVFYRLLRALSRLEIPLDSGDFCLLDRQVLFAMRSFQEDRPFVRGIRTWVGFPQAAIEYDRAERMAGESKYDTMKLIRLALDGLLSYSDVFLKASIVCGLVISLLSFGYAAYIAVMRVLIALGLASGSNLIRGWATIVCALMLLVGLQFIFMGVIGEYVGRIFIQTKGRPLFVVKEEIGFRRE